MMTQERPYKEKRPKKGRNAALFFAVVVIGSVLVMAFATRHDSGVNPDVAAAVNEQEEEQRKTQDENNGGMPDVSAEDWQLTLVNETSPLEEDYAPDLAELNNGLKFDSRAISALNNMLADGNAKGLDLIVCSAYRSVVQQTELFRQQVARQQEEDSSLDYEQAVAAAKTVVTYPGRSEHNLGLAADIVCEGYQNLDDDFAKTEAAIWLKENCAQYGFILRYPQGKMGVTGVIYEPWHFRYVGVESAKYIYENDLCLEEFLTELAKSQD